MKKIIIGLGILFIIIPIFSIQEFLNYPELSEYGKGYVLGKFLIMVIGIVLLYWGIKMKKIEKEVK